MIFSCEKNDTDSPYVHNDYNAGRIQIIGHSDESISKTSYDGYITSWIAGSDELGLYSPQAKVTPGGATGVVNARYTAQNSAFSSSFSGSMYWGTGEHYFYAYYPYKSGTFTRDAVPVSLSENQTQSSGGSTLHLGEDDFMIATPVTISAPQSENDSIRRVNMVFNHLFVLLEIQIKQSSGNLSVSEVVITGENYLAFNTSGTVDIGQSTPDPEDSYSITFPSTIPSGISNRVVLALSSSVTPTRSYTTTPKIYLMVLPKTGTSVITFAIKCGSDYKFIQKRTPTGGFSRGRKYIVQMDLSNATEYPGTNLSPVTIESVTWAPVNCGYDSDSTYGRYYQFYRKFGLGYGNYTSVAEPGPFPLETGSDVLKRGVFLSRGVSSTYDWADEQPETWSMTDFYNPCPPGWRVPDDTEIQSLVDAGHTWVSSGGTDNLAGRYFGGDHSSTREGSIFLPASGALNANGAPLAQPRGTIAYYRTINTITYNNEPRSSAIYFSATVFYDINSGGVSSLRRSFAASVRCVKK